MGKAGIAKVAIHSREYLSCVKLDGLFLVLDLVHLRVLRVDLD